MKPLITILTLVFSSTGFSAFANADGVFVVNGKSLATEVPVASYGENEIKSLGNLVSLCERIGNWTFGTQYKLLAVAKVGTGPTGGESVYAEGTCIIAYPENIKLKAVLVPLGAEQTVYPGKKLQPHDPIALFDLKTFLEK